MYRIGARRVPRRGGLGRGLGLCRRNAPVQAEAAVARTLWPTSMPPNRGRGGRAELHDGAVSEEWGVKGHALSNLCSTDRRTITFRQYFKKWNRMAPQTKKTVIIRPSEFGSRKASAEKFQELVNDLAGDTVGSEHLNVTIYNSDDRYEWPAHSIADAIRDHDVKRIEGTIPCPFAIALRSRSSPYTFTDSGDGESRAPTPRRPTIILDLRNGDHFRTWDWLFHISGDESQVDALKNLILKHAYTWPKTSNWVFHSYIWYVLFVANWLIVLPLSYISGYSHASHKGTLFVAILALAVVLFGLSLYVILLGGKWAPYVWFYRPEGYVDRRSGWLCKSTAGLAFVLITGILASSIANFLTNRSSTQPASPTSISPLDAIERPEL